MFAQMFAMTRPRMLVAVIVGVSFAALLALGAFSSTASANHPWSTYHWGHTGTVKLQLDDNLTTTAWKDHLKKASDLGTNVTYDPSDSLTGIKTHDWNDSTVLKTAIAPSSTNRQCSPTSGRVEVCNGKYGNNGWVGLASIWLSGGHIVQGTAKMNDTYSMNAYTKQQVMCQEVGHTFGLGHQDTSRNSTFNSCMTYDNPNADNDQWPNSHDYKQLESIYNADAATGGHVDSSNTFSNTSAASKLPAAARAVDPADPSQRGRLIDRSSNGRVEIYERDFGKGNKVITRVIRVDESTPAPEGSGPGKSPQDDGHTHDDGAAH